MDLIFLIYKEMGLVCIIVDNLIINNKIRS